MIGELSCYVCESSVEGDGSVTIGGRPLCKDCHTEAVRYRYEARLEKINGMVLERLKWCDEMIQEITLLKSAISTGTLAEVHRCLESIDHLNNVIQREVRL